ncbi:MAG: hypothetical protein AAGA90_17815 [Actinomycetota bacterium]
MSPHDPSPETPYPTEEIPTAAPPRRRGSVLAGALVGALALTASVVGVSAIAGAQDDSEVDEGEAAEAEEMSEEDLDGVEIVELDDDDLDGEIVLDDIELDEAAWQPYDECVEAQLGDLESTIFGDAEEIDEDSISDEDLEALDDAWMAADEACFDLLPEDAKAEVEAFTAYDQCLTDAGFSDEMGAVVYVEDGETGQSIQFGESTGTVTITGDASGVSIATDGDVSVLDDEAFEAAFEACDELLPEDLFELDEDVEMDEGDLDGDDDETDEGDEDDA